MDTRNVMAVVGARPGLLILMLAGGIGALVYYAAVIGHWFAVWLRFRAGIGQAGAIGVPRFVVVRSVMSSFFVSMASRLPRTWWWDCRKGRMWSSASLLSSCW